jgi:NhaA family Na+:H+ antiporter
MASRSELPAWLRVILDNSLLLIAGAVAALVWANLDVEQYNHVTHGPLHFAVNDIGMVFFFALATKEVVEAMLPGGPLSSPRQAAVPVFAAVGGMIVPAGIYVALVLGIGQRELLDGAAIPCATDIAFSYLVARIIFPSGHPAIPFLLLLAIADDAMGLIILAVFYPSGPLSVGALVVWMIPAVGIAWMMRRRRVTSHWAFVLVPGAMSWAALFLGGLHPALALVPIVPFMPVKMLHEFEHWWKIPVQIILFAFGLANAGVPLSAVGPVTWIIMAGLILGKPLGIVSLTWVAERIGFTRADGLDYRALVALGITAGIGFTVALFFTTAAFPPGAILDEAKMGALLSFLAAPLAIGAGWMFRLKGRAAPEAPRRSA